DYIIVRKPGGRTTNRNRLQVVEGFSRKQSRMPGGPPRSMPCERISDQKILELTQKMMELVDGTRGHRDLYKDVVMEDRQSRLSPDRSPSSQTDGEIGFPVVALDGEPEDSMIIDTGPEDVDACEGDLGPGGVDACDTTASSVEGYGIRIKEEPVSDEEGGVADGNLSTPIPYTCVRIKEEPPMFEEVPGDDAGHIKEETVPAEEDNCSTPNIYTPRDQGEFSPTHIKEEPVTFLNVLDISRQADGTHVPPTRTAPETLAYEVEIPVDKAPVKGPDNASLYSVRQKEDSMEILYHCPSCYKGFSSNLDLARHQVIHTVDKLFICSLCGKSFTEMSFLVKHQVIHTDLKLCVCPVCGGCFYSETSLAKHQKTHSLPLFCSTCGKCFFNKTELAIHERKHSGERPFGCHICGKHFIAKSVLNKHVLIHTSMERRK
ncbi:PREDICTED: zinc finger protein 570-like, partial [Nanorana parkeri]|uniref:zinc finger protein 570-like n=1 Tax=Nanorana parkeri TaxID=125878 RepID=UPI000854B758